MFRFSLLNYNKPVLILARHARQPQLLHALHAQQLERLHQTHVRATPGFTTRMHHPLLV